MTRNKNVSYLVLCAVLIALSIGLNQIKLLHLPYGGSITLLSMLAATLCGYFCGPKWGLSSGLALGLLNLAIGGYVIHPVQLLLDYILAFAALGLTGLADHLPKKWGLYAAMILAAVGRALCATLAGIFFWQSAPWASLVYNGTYLIPETIICILLALLIAKPVMREMRRL